MSFKVTLKKSFGHYDWKRNNVFSNIGYIFWKVCSLCTLDKFCYMYLHPVFIISQIEKWCSRCTPRDLMKRGRKPSPWQWACERWKARSVTWGRGVLQSEKMFPRFASVTNHHKMMIGSRWWAIYDFISYYILSHSYAYMVESSMKILSIVQKYLLYTI